MDTTPNQGPVNLTHRAQIITSVDCNQVLFCVVLITSLMEQAAFVDRDVLIISPMVPNVRCYCKPNTFQLTKHRLGREKLKIQPPET